MAKHFSADDLNVVDDVPCRKCGKQPWNTHVVIVQGTHSSMEEEITEWCCGVTGRMEERPIASGFPALHVEVICLACGHIWWSRHKAAVTAAKRIYDQVPVVDYPSGSLSDLFAAWDQEVAAERQQKLQDSLGLTGDIGGGESQSRPGTAAGEQSNNTVGQLGSSSSSEPGSQRVIQIRGLDRDKCRECIDDTGDWIYELVLSEEPEPRWREAFGCAAGDAQVHVYGKRILLRCKPSAISALVSRVERAVSCANDVA